MDAANEGESRHRIDIIDDDPLRARREARELLNDLQAADGAAELNVLRDRTIDESRKGGVSADLVGVLFGGGSFVAAAVQIWLARVPQRTVVVTRPDGATLRITGREARADDERVERFLRGDDTGTDGAA
ncbi:effector-associated constant component EACC1 [Actinomadura sediminis]|uniref:Uncharacterized protein n=1 Tax=Actinomadura sediminis TaxID=1038904 RepID=A0ABW3EKC1_9ACTN